MHSIIETMPRRRLFPRASAAFGNKKQSAQAGIEYAILPFEAAPYNGTKEPGDRRASAERTPQFLPNY